MKNLAKLRKEKGLSQQKLGNEIGLARNTICQYESGNRVPDVDTLIKIADYFNVSIDYLLGREVKEKNQPSQTEKVDFKPAFSRNRKETVDMFLYRYQNVIDEEYFWILVELCSHIEKKDGMELFATLCNSMIEKGYPALEYYTEAYRYFVDGVDKPIVWNEACPKLTIDEKKYIVENIAKELSDKLSKDYVKLLDDKSFRDTAKLYNEYPEELRTQILEMIIDWLTAYIQKLHIDYKLPNDILGRN